MEDNVIIEESTVAVDNENIEQQKEQQNILLLLLDVIE